MDEAVFLGDKVAGDGNKTGDEGKVGAHNMEIHKEKQQENFTLVVTRDVSDANGAREMQNERSRDLYMQIVKEME